jgi:hypothetical protein
MKKTAILPIFTPPRHAALQDVKYSQNQSANRQ